MSSRVKKCLEPTVLKYMDFLNDVSANFENEFQSLSGLIEYWKINKTVKKALIDLAIIDFENDNKWTWLQGAPDRTLSLTVLNYLLERSKKSRTTVIAGLEETNAVLRSLSETVNNYIQRRESILKQTPMPSNGNLFAEQDTKTDLINKAAFAIASGMYQDNINSANSNIGSNYDIEYINRRIVFAAKDLVNQLLK